MTKGKYYDAVVAKLIEDDKTTLNITRTITEEKEYGNVSVRTEDVTEYGRLYQGTGSRPSSENPDYQIGGRSYRDTVVQKLLLRTSADIKRGDVFTNDGDTYIVRHVHTYKGYAKVAYLELK